MYEQDVSPVVSDARTPVKSAQRVLDILELFATMKGPATLSAIASALEMPKSSCLALLNTLEINGYLYQLRRELGYYPTRRWLDKAQIIGTHDPLIEKIRPVMTALRDVIGETILLGKRVDDRLMHVEVVESLQTLRYTAVSGQFKSLHVSASGKSVLASLPVAERVALLARLRLERVTQATITDRVELERDIREGIARGWQMVRGENNEGVSGIGAPMSLAGETYVLTAAGPSNRMDHRADEIGAQIIAACCALEKM
jgi:IclR family transcriptional regulator, acetate operon repressor